MKNEESPAFRRGEEVNQVFPTDPDHDPDRVPDPAELTAAMARVGAAARRGVVVRDCEYDRVFVTHPDVAGPKGAPER